MKSKLLFVFLLFQISSVQSEIDNKEIIMEILNGCMSEQPPNISTGKMLEYCACYANQISMGMDLEEVMLLGMDLLTAGDDKEKAAQIGLANEKIKKYLSICLPRLYQ
tara:strand:+ start:668 stop:991 length:324 start_codon:yes stop_codon:yes gene_type:complete